MKKLYGALFLLSIIWSMSFLFIKLLLEELGPENVVFYRCLFGAITLLIVLLIFKVKIPYGELPKLWLLLGISLFNHAIPWLLISVSETHIQSNEAAVLNAFTPIATLVIGFFFFSQKIQNKQWIGLLVGIIGLIIMMNFHISSIFSHNILYSLIMVIVTFCYGIGTHLTKKYLQQIDVILVSFITVGLSAISSFIYTLLTGNLVIKPLANMNVLGSLIVLGVLGSGVAYLLFYYMVKEGSAEFATMVTYIVPVFAALWGFLFINEPISPKMVVGLIILLVGVYITTSKRKVKIKKANTNAAS